MIKRTLKRLNYLRARDYVSPGLESPPDHLARYFPEVKRFAPAYFRVPHYKWADRRFPQVGVTTWDETVLLYNYALQVREGHFLEIGSWVGWSTLALALGSSNVTAVDPLFASHTAQRRTCQAALDSAELASRVRLVGDSAPDAIGRLANKEGMRWDAFFIDGDHSGDAPIQDAIACARVAPANAIVLFHDALQANVGDALMQLSTDGWTCAVHCTSQFLGVATRGAVAPLRHLPDPRVRWIPWIDDVAPHLRRFRLLGLAEGS